jgi:hypothetical protein
VVVAGQSEHAAVRRRAGHVAVLERVARAVDARSLAVPHGEDAVVFGAREQADLLAAPHRGRGEVLVDARLEVDVVALDETLGAPQLAVEAAERRAAIARDEARGVQPGGDVALALHHRQPDQRLGAGEIDAPLVEHVFVVEADRRERHLRSSRAPAGGISRRARAHP